MAEFSGGEEKLVRENEPIVFENKTDSSFDVSMGVVFHKSGTYEVSIVGNKTTVSEVGKGRSEGTTDIKAMFTDSERYKLSDILQNYYCEGLEEIAEEDEILKSIMQKVGLIDAD